MSDDKKNMLTADSRFLVSFLLEDSLQGWSKKTAKAPFRPTTDELSVHKNRFLAYSPEAAQSFIVASHKIIPFVCEEEFQQWTNFGIRLLEISKNDVFLVQAFFDSSESVCAKTSFTYLKGWVEKGMEVAKSSVTTAATYYELTRSFIRFSNNIQLQKWGDWCIHLMDRDASSGLMGSNFLEHSIDCLKFMTFREFREYKDLGFMFFRLSKELGKRFFAEVALGMNDLDVTQRRTLYHLTKSVSRYNEDEAFAFFSRYPQKLVEISPNERNRALTIIENLSKTDVENIANLFHHLISILKGLPYPRQILILEQCEKVIKASRSAGQAFLLNINQILDRVPDCFLTQFVDTGILIDSSIVDDMEGYFSLNSEKADQEIKKWGSATLLEEHQKTLFVLATAMTGKSIDIRTVKNSEDSKYQNQSSTDGRIIYLPEYMADADTLEKNKAQYKITTAHQAGLIEFHTFSSDLPVMVKMLADLPQDQMALDIFFILEHGRIDFQLANRYPGLKQQMTPAIAQELRKRPEPNTLPLKEALVEILLMFSVKPFNPAYAKNLKRPSKFLSPHLSFLSRTLSGFYENNNSVWHCFEKTYEIYHTLKALTNQKKGWAEEPYHPCRQLNFRGHIHPLALQGQLDTENASMDAQPMAPDQKEKESGQLPDQLPEKIRLIAGDGAGSSGITLNNKDLSFITVENQQPETPIGVQPFRFQSGALAEVPMLQSDGNYYYDEWDYIQMAYRKKWCCLEEIRLKPGTMDKITTIYSQNRNLIQKVKANFQQIKPMVYENIPRVDWGDEIDLAAVIEGVVDKKTGNMPSDKVFIRKERKKQSLSVLFLVDMSASTGNPIRFNRTNNLTPTVLSDETAASSPSASITGKKIIDVEIESLIVVMEALESLCHEYAIYGFSGYGRDNVNVYEIKAFKDSYGDDLKKRIGAMEAQKSTRMGAAIRHAATKLEKQETEQRLLILLSDGFPQDYDYGEDRASYEYGINDTMMALMETKLRDIMPFCITVDHEGKDYLKNMCEPSSYLVIKDILSLPELLPKVVASLIH